MEEIRLARAARTAAIAGRGGALCTPLNRRQVHVLVSDAARSSAGASASEKTKRTGRVRDEDTEDLATTWSITRGSARFDDVDDVTNDAADVDARPAKRAMTSAAVVAEWTVKHQPQHVEDVVIRPSTVRDTVLGWLRSRKKNEAGPRILVLHGPVGSGKSTLVRAAFADMEYELAEPGGADTLRAVFKSACSMGPAVPLAGRDRALLYADINGLYVGGGGDGKEKKEGKEGKVGKKDGKRKEGKDDRDPVDGGVEAVYDFLSFVRNVRRIAPIVFTVTDFDKRGLQVLKKVPDVVRVVYCRALTDVDVDGALTRIANLERVPNAATLVRQAMTAACVHSGVFDLRQGVAALQYAAACQSARASGVLVGQGRWKMAAAASRDHLLSVFDATRALVNGGGSTRGPSLDTLNVWAECIPNFVSCVACNCYEGLAPGRVGAAATVKDMDGVAEIAAALCDIDAANKWRNGHEPEPLAKSALTVTALGTIQAVRAAPGQAFALQGDGPLPVVYRGGVGGGGAKGAGSRCEAPSLSDDGSEDGTTTGPSAELSNVSAKAATIKSLRAGSVLCVRESSIAISERLWCVKLLHDHPEGSKGPEATLRTADDDDDDDDVTTFLSFAARPQQALLDPWYAMYGVPKEDVVRHALMVPMEGYFAPASSTARAWAALDSMGVYNL